MKVGVADSVVDYYTDILAHSFEPEPLIKDSFRIAAGTTFGNFVILEHEETNDAFVKFEASLPNSAAILGLHWGRAGVFLSSKNLLYLYRSDDKGQIGGGGGDEDMDTLNLVKFECMFDVQDVTCLKNAKGSTVFGACDDSKVRAWDVETQKLLVEFGDHKSPVEVCRANDEFLVSGGQDGNVMVYDALLRSPPKPVVSFTQEKKMITGLDISGNSTWIAAGSKGTPVVYNLKNSAILPSMKVSKPQMIHTIHFDADNSLWWAGGGSRLFKSENLTSVSREVEAKYGEGIIHHIYSISTSKPKRLSIAGATTGILFSRNAEYWDGMVHM